MRNSMYSMARVDFGWYVFKLAITSQRPPRLAFHYSLPSVFLRRYTRRGLKGLHSLKGRDRGAADLLLEAAAGGGGLELNLAILTKHESGYTFDVGEE